MEFCLKFNRNKFGKNYSSSKFFIHIRGGASIKYKFNRYGLFDKNITNDIDLIIIPFENNPDIRIKLLEKFNVALKKEFPKYMWRYTIENLKIKFYINDIKIFDIVFYDNINPWYKNYEQTEIHTTVIRKLNNFILLDEYFNSLKKLFELELDNQETLEKVTFTSLEYEYQALKLLIDISNKKYIENVKQLKYNNASEIEIYNIKAKIKNKIYRYKKKLFYLSHIMISY